jgi:hypothetical protein
VVFVALGISAWSSGRLTGVWFPAVLLILAPTVGVLNLLYGGLEPIGIAALCAAALAFERNRPSLGGALTVLALIEPHLGVPAVVAAFALIPRSRVAIVAGAAIFALASVALLGWGTVVEYVRAVLPAQSAGEGAISTQQYSLTHLVYLAGVSTKVATTLGSIWYLGAIALGTFAAARIRALFGRASAVVLVPVAISLFGGLYVHNHQIAAALPGALLLAPFRGNSARVRKKSSHASRSARASWCSLPVWRCRAASSCRVCCPCFSLSVGRSSTRCRTAGSRWPRNRRRLRRTIWRRPRGRSFCSGRRVARSTTPRPSS